MQLQQAFDISPGDVVAFVGAGGKTSLLVGLGYELAEAGWRVLATATADIATEQLGLYPHAMRYDSGAQAISEALSRHQFVFLYDNNSWRSGFVSGPQEEWTRQLLDSVDSDVLLVEADRSRGLPFKAPFGDEPWIPSETSLVVPVASLAALGKPLDEDHIYNPRALTERYGFVENSPVRSPWLAQVLRDDAHGLKNVPNQARVIVFLNRTPERGYLRGPGAHDCQTELAKSTYSSGGVGICTRRGAGTRIAAGDRSDRLGGGRPIGGSATQDVNALEARQDLARPHHGATNALAHQSYSCRHLPLGEPSAGHSEAPWRKSGPYAAVGNGPSPGKIKRHAPTKANYCRIG